MGGITVYNSSNIPQAHVGEWKSSDYDTRSGLAIRHNNIMSPVEDFAFGSLRFGPNNWSTANLNNGSWSSWRVHWFSQVGTIQSDRYLVKVIVPTVMDKNHARPVNPWYTAFGVTVAFGRTNETVPFGFALNETAYSHSYNGEGDLTFVEISSIFNPYNTTGSSNFLPNDQFKIRVQTRVQGYASVWFRGVEVIVEPI